MSVISDTLSRIMHTLPSDGSVTLVAVSKFHPAEAILQAYDAGQRVFGESRAAELTQKAAELPQDIKWHFIGHLQTNKVRPVVRVAEMIHSIDSERLLRAVDAEAIKQGRIVKVLLQVHVAQEETKFGFSPEELEAFVTPQLVESLKGVEIAGVMGMATNTDEVSRIEADFDAIRRVYDNLAAGPFAGDGRFGTLSMGMSHDYRLAIAHGTTMVRIGTDIFGQRQY